MDGKIVAASLRHGTRFAACCAVVSSTMAQAEPAPREARHAGARSGEARAEIPDVLPGDEQEPGDEVRYLIGARYRGILLPKFALNAFVDGGESVYVNGLGPELVIVTDDMEYNLSAWAAFYDMGPVAIKGSSDVEEAWEIVESDLTALYLTADFLWTSQLTSELDFTYGGSAGLGILWGNLLRTQAYLREGGQQGVASDYRACQGLDTPDFTYCDDANQHYAGYSEPHWLEGGARPVAYPWLSGQVGLRYQPSPRVVTRLDLGIGSSGLFFGLGADYSM